ncbi:MAG TPA: rhomboid family intramembrane serine protease [Planctomycetota bacterium]|jgi:rhomboid protease GluP
MTDNMTDGSGHPSVPTAPLETDAATRPAVIVSELPLPQPLVPKDFIPWATYWLAFANGMVFFVMLLFMGTDLLWPKADALLIFGANHGPNTVAQGQFWRLFTCTFVHAGPLHLGFNLWVLFSVGPLAECVIGRRRFLLLYLMSGLWGSLASLWWNPAAVGVGASGAIFGVFGVLAVFFGKHRTQYDPEVVKKQAKQIYSLIGYNLLFGLMISGVGNAAHVGGLAAGYLGASAMLPPDAQRRSPRREALAMIILASVLAVGYCGAGWRVRTSPAVIRLVRAREFKSYADRILPIVREQESLAKKLMGTKPASDEAAAAPEDSTNARRILGQLQQIEATDVEIAEIHAQLIKYGEALVAMASARTAAERETSARNLSESAGAFTTKMRALFSSLQSH